MNIKDFFSPGAIVGAVLLSIVATYVVRVFDFFWAKASTTSKKYRAELKERRRILVQRGTEDFSVYLALIAEASRLRMRAVRCLLNTAGFAGLLIVFMLYGQENGLSGVYGLIAALGIISFVILAMVNWQRAVGLDVSVRNIEGVLREIRTANGMKVEQW